MSASITHSPRIVAPTSFHPQRTHRRVASVRASSSSSSSSSSSLQEIFTIADTTRRGIDADEETRAQVERAIDSLAVSSSSSSSTSIGENSIASSGRWRLRYSTEKETLFLLGLSENVEAYQTIDAKNRTLSNEVIFGGNSPRSTVFRVEATIEPSKTKRSRVDFSFTSASLRLSNGWTIPIPPFGRGWFDDVYVDTDGGYRVSRDSRGDTLVCESA